MEVDHDAVVNNCNQDDSVQVEVPEPLQVNQETEGGNEQSVQDPKHVEAERVEVDPQVHESDENQIEVKSQT
jgi:hypothetical protein